jgi:serine/threonine protein phosphatase PrpC
MTFESVCRTHVGLRRTLNEDSVLTLPERGLWAVADGMGGHEAGEVASALIVDLLRANPGDGGLPSRVAAARQALSQANGELVAMAQGGPSKRTIGATAVVLTTDNERFACLWAGDSRGYLVRAGELHPLTRDHSLVQELVDAGLWPASEAAAHPDAHVIRRAVGAEDRLDVDAKEGELESRDIFLLASDGLTRLVTDDEILACLEARGLDEAADWLIATTLERGAPDNVSLILVQAA